MSASAIVAISGRIGSGKSSVATAVAFRLNCKVASFGNVVRGRAAIRGVQATRENLQSIGEELVTADPAAFCRTLLLSVNWMPGQPLVIDGVRHVVIWEALKQIVAPQRVILVHISAEEEIRAARLLERAPTDLLASVEAHTTEADVAMRLPKLAEIAMETTGKSIDEAADSISDKIRELTA